MYHTKYGIDHNAMTAVELLAFIKVYRTFCYSGHGKVPVMTQRLGLGQCDPLFMLNGLPEDRIEADKQLVVEAVWRDLFDDDLSWTDQPICWQIPKSNHIEFKEAKKPDWEYLEQYGVGRAAWAKELFVSNDVFKKSDILPDNLFRMKIRVVAAGFDNPDWFFC